MTTPMQSIAPLLVVAALWLPSMRPTSAQEVLDVHQPAAAGGAGCNCRNAADMQAPPWHGNVTGMDCGPMCPPGNMFHAYPCGQLRQACQAKHGRLGCVTLPPCFPRLHAWCAEGSMPTPRPIAVPRCPECGALIEGGL